MVFRPENVDEIQWGILKLKQKLKEARKAEKEYIFLKEKARAEGFYVVLGSFIPESKKPSPASKEDDIFGN